MYFENEHDYFRWVDSGGEEPPAKCKYCECEHSEHNKVVLRKIRIGNKNIKELICEDCLNEELQEENQKIEENVSPS